MEFLDFENLKRFSNNPFIIWCNNPDKRQIYCYSDIIEASQKIKTILIDNLQVQKCDKIAILFDHCPQIISVILSILNSECSFCPISTSAKYDEIAKSLKRYESKYLISSIDIDEIHLKDFKLKISLNVFGFQIYFYKNLHEIPPSSYHFGYLIQTSGSTGLPKVVKVPFNCIKPNIESLSQLYNITSEDVIFVFSPPTFDPFIVDIFLALRNGAKLLMTSNHLRLNSKILVKLMSPSENESNFNGATIAQMTPSILKILSPEFLEEILFNENSNLRILVLGGELFPPINEVKLWKVWKLKKRKRIFNIYGITEVSCWSTIEEITEDSKEISLGKPIDTNTILQVRNIEDCVIQEGIGELYIGSRIRKCVIDNEDVGILESDAICYRRTGDLVSIKDNGKLKYEGRTNEVVKRFGHRVYLRKIEQIVKNLIQISNAHCIIDKNENHLILFVKALSHEIQEESSIRSYLMNKLENYEIPDDIVFIDEIPLSCHGKISKQKLLEIYREKRKWMFCTKSNSQNLPEIFKDWLIQILGINEIKRMKLSWDESSFKTLGGNSFLALNLVTKLENFTKKSHSNILEMLLNDDCVLNEVFIKLKDEEAGLHTENRINECKDIKLNTDFHMKILWKHNLHKCVDANPTIIFDSDRPIVSVGSHSHLLVNLNAFTGDIISSLKLGDRIESQVTTLGFQVGFVGCYDGNLYKFDVNSGEILWKFNSNGMIKCKSLVFDDFIIFGNYSIENNLFCLNVNDGTLIWSIKFGIKGILSSPIQIDTESFVIGALDGTFGRIRLKTGEVYWKLNLNSPIFSTCNKLSEDTFVLAEVNGLIHCFDVSGHECWNFKADGTIFSSFEIFRNNCNYHIIFGCHDYNLYCLEFKDQHISLKWKTLLQSQIYSTPKRIFLNKKFWIISCSILGFVNILDIENGQKEISLQLDGEIFSTPAIYENVILIGCRDNNLYAIEIT